MKKKKKKTAPRDTLPQATAAHHELCTCVHAAQHHAPARVHTDTSATTHAMPTHHDHMATPRPSTMPCVCTACMPAAGMWPQFKTTASRELSAALATSASPLDRYFLRECRSAGSGEGAAVDEACRQDLAQAWCRDAHAAARHVRSASCVAVWGKHLAAITVAPMTVDGWGWWLL